MLFSTDDWHRLRWPKQCAHLIILDLRQNIQNRFVSSIAASLILWRGKFLILCLQQPTNVTY